MRKCLFLLLLTSLAIGGCGSPKKDESSDPLYAPTDPKVGKTERPTLGGPGADVKSAPVSPD